MREYDPKGFLRSEPRPEPVQPSAHGFIWGFGSSERARQVAEQLTAQNRAGRQARGCEPRRFTARGSQFWAEPLT